MNRGSANRPCGVHYGLGGLHLDLEPQRAVDQAQPLFEQGQQLDQDLDLFDGRHLGEGEHGRRTERGDEQVERANPAFQQRGRVERLEPDPHPRRRGGPATDQFGRADRVGVLGVVGPQTVAVLEVHPQVLDRLAAQLRHHLVVHRLGQVRRQAEHLGERPGPARVLLERRQRRCSPLGRHVARDPVGRHVTGVHRLPAARVARVSRRPRGVHFGQAGDRVGEQRAVEGGPHALRSVRRRAG